jgi:uncharacterized protein HemY
MALTLSIIVFVLVMIVVVCVLTTLSDIYQTVWEVKVYVVGLVRKLDLVSTYLEEALPRRDDKGRFVKNGS